MLCAEHSYRMRLTQLRNRYTIWPRSNPMPKQHDDQTLFNALEHIVYEIRMFADLTFTGMNYPRQVQFAILEAWAIHLRGIESMLEEKPQRDDDVLISHYGPVDIKLLVEPSVRKRINGEITHITTRRMSEGVEKEWNRVEIFRQAWPGIEKIIDVLIAWVNEYQPDSIMRSELDELRTHGFLLHAVATSGALFDNLKGDTEAHMPHLAVTHAYGYLPENQSDKGNSNIPFL